MRRALDGSLFTRFALRVTNCLNSVEKNFYLCYNEMQHATEELLCLIIMRVI